MTVQWPSNRLDKYFFKYFNAFLRLNCVCIGIVDPATPILVEDFFFVETNGTDVDAAVTASKVRVGGGAGVGGGAVVAGVDDIVCIEVGAFDVGSREQFVAEVVLILHVKGLKFLKQHYYCDIYISQIKVFLDGGNKYSILDSYAFNDREEEEEELKSLEKELMLDSDFIQCFRKEEKEKIQKKINEERETFEQQKKRIEELESRLSNF